MKWMDCRATRREIDQAEVAQQLSAQALAHIASCATCQTFHHERARLRDLVASLEPVSAPPDFDLRLRARLATQRQNGAPRSFFATFVLSTPAIIVAAVVIMLGASMAWFVQRSANRTPIEASKAPTRTTEGNSTGVNKSTDSTRVASLSVAADKTPATAAGESTLVPGVRGGKPSPQFKEPGGRSGQPGITSRDLDVRSAPSIKQGQGDGEVSLSAPVKPLVVSMQDDRGATRKISLPPVSFGSQRLVDNRIPVNSTSRIW